MAIRSGRFRFSVTDSEPNAKTIIRGKTGDTYRIFNSGDADFKVAFGGPQAVTVRPGFSFDFPVMATTKLTSTSTTATSIAGIYELLSIGATGRSGRFKFQNETTTGPTEAYIIYGGDRKLYRIFNSGKLPFDVYFVGMAGSDKYVELGANESFDVALPIGTAIRVNNPNTVTDVIEGIYEVVDGVADIRNGRFEEAEATTQKKKPIIGLSRNTSVTGFYRIYNSGENAIGIYRENLDTPRPSPNHVLEKRCSVDFYIGSGGERRFISVGAAEELPDPEDSIPIEGSYAFLSS